MTCTHLVDSGVYVLGALAPAQRIAFEQHLATCTECQAEVTELAVLPGLLGRLDEPSLLVDDDPPSPSVLPVVLAKVHRQRRGRRVLAGAAALVLAVLALVAGLNMPSTSASRPNPNLANPPASSAPVTPSPVPSSPSTNPVVMHDMISVDPADRMSAQVGLTPVLGGTQIALTCQYPQAFGVVYHGKKWFGLYAVPRNGKPAQEISTWGASPGDVIPVPATLTSWSIAQMSRIELRDSQGHTLLYYNL
jgi:hypothetical protein